MFFSVACHDPACWRWEALAAQQTFVIMSEVLSSLLIMTKSILCMCSPQQMGDWQQSYVCVCVCGQFVLNGGTFWLIPVVFALSSALTNINHCDFVVLFWPSATLCNNFANSVIHISLIKLNESLSLPFSQPLSSPFPPSLIHLTMSVSRYCHLSVREAAVSVHRAGQSQPVGHWGSTWQCQQSAGIGAEISWQG